MWIEIINVVLKREDESIVSDVYKAVARIIRGYLERLKNGPYDSFARLVHLLV
jgi:hypothetical protein